MRYRQLLAPDIDDTPDVLFAQPVLRTILHKTILGVNKEHALAFLGAALVDYDDGRRYASSEEKIWWESNDPLY